ncbi:hypothetical protein GGTG_10938 [Gaeumannomyces tritici R3-111a-1]|uniref:Uncharacterized protein n=1 Tax=Gaeumannomyces tritici (strain R3-111a-1) TaxID=644352 RepID=J3PBR7_GAET3|nr:hypothetical protein GGTG_10938 [Gaeumannomyces tritici R3-111a-1]EJT71684.1 hypothetical protein GGTG_10938 [Gaeumannomyces tritici R3-111a-1]
MATAVAGAALVVAKELVLVGIQLSGVPKQIGRCIELTRACHNSLRELARLREEHRAALTPDKLRRIDDTIVMGTKAFDEVCTIVGRFGPQAFSGVGLFSRLRWQYKDSHEFEEMRHIIERNNIDINEAITRIILIAELQPVTRMAMDYLGQREQQSIEFTRENEPVNTYGKT